MKNITLKIIALAAVFSCGSQAAASDFNLSFLNAADIKATNAVIKAPVPQLPSDELIGVEMSVRVPYKTVRNVAIKITTFEKRLIVIDPTAPVVWNEGNLQKFGNIRVDMNGVMVTPVLTLKPSLEARDKLALRIQRVKLHASTEPSVKSAPLPEINLEELVAKVMDSLIVGVYAAVNERFKAQGIPLTAEQAVTVKYDKADWTLRATFSPRIVSQFVPAGFLGDLHLTGFSLSDAGIVLKIQTVEKR